MRRTRLWVSEITDRMITRAALKQYAIVLWHDYAGGSRYFGSYLYEDLILRCKELREETK